MFLIKHSKTLYPSALNFLPRLTKYVEENNGFNFDLYEIEIILINDDYVQIRVKILYLSCKKIYSYNENSAFLGISF